MLNDPLQFPVDLFTQRIRDAIHEVHRNNKAPQPMIATSALTALSLACQNHARVKLPNGKVSPVALYSLTAAESGAGKSACDNAFMAPFHEADVKFREDNARNSGTFEATLAAWKAESKAILSQIGKATKEGTDATGFKTRLIVHEQLKPIALPQRRFIYNNATPQATILGLSKNGGSIGLISDEGGKQLFGPAFAETSILSQIWDGTSIFVDLVSSESFQVLNPTLTISLQTQPGEYERFMRKRGQQAFASGFINRFLVCFPVTTQGLRAQDYYSTDCRRDRETFHSRIRELINLPAELDRTSGKPRIVEFSARACDCWWELFNRAENAQQNGGPLQNIRGAASKSLDNVARIAAIIHIFEGFDGEVSAETIQRAIGIGRWYLDHFQAQFDKPQLPQYISDGELLKSWLAGQMQWPDGFVYYPKAKLRQYAPNALRKDGRLDAAIDYLTMQGCVQIVKVDRIPNVRFANLHYAPLAVRI